MKKLYRQFNRLNMETRLEPMEVSNLEKERIKKNVLKQRNKRLPRTLSVAIIFMVTLLVLSLTVSITNPTLAAKLPIIGNIFELFKEDNKEYIFDEYSDHTTGIGATQKSNGVSVTINDAVYDKESITITYTLKSEEDLGVEPFLEAFIETKEYERNYTPGRTMSKKISDNEHAVVDILYIMNGKRHDQVNVNFEGKQIRRSFDEEEPIKGDWAFEFTLDALETETQKVDGIFTENEEVKINISKITHTPVSTNFYFSKSVSEALKEKSEEWDAVIVDYLVYDNLGNDYNVLYNAGYGDSKYTMRERFSTTPFHKEATSITIVPEVSIYKGAEVIQGPFKLNSMEVPLDFQAPDNIN